MRWSIPIALMAAWCASAEQKQVAITFDDLPRGGDGSCILKDIENLTRRLVRPFADSKIPFIGFVNEGRCEMPDVDLRRILSIWLDAGATLGNHTYSHGDLNKLSVSEFEADILKGERITQALMRGQGKTDRFLRHPFLHVGLTLDKRRDAEQMIASHNYRIAPVTLDNSDYLFARVYAAALQKEDKPLAQRLMKEYLLYMQSIFAFFERRALAVAGKPISQILLLHANELNAKAMPHLIAMMRKRKYRFITLMEALEDQAYSQLDTYAGTGGFSWIHHWSMTKGMPGEAEPDPPTWIQQEALH